MLIEFGQGQKIVLTDADMYVLKFMLGIIPQGHGHVRVRSTVPACVYLRHAYSLSLKDARDIMLQAEQKLFSVSVV